MAIPEQDSSLIKALQAEVARLTAQVATLEGERSDAFAELRMEIETLDSERQWLNESLEWYAELYEFAPIAYLALDSAGLIRDINLTGAALLGRERQRLLGRPMRLHVAAADRTVFLEHMWRCRHAPGQVTSELQLLGESGRHFPAQLISRRAVGGPAGPTLRTAIFDLTERKRVEADLQLSHQRLSLALVASEAGLYEYSWPRGRLWVSPRWSQIVGRDATGPKESDALWSWFEERIHPDDLAARARAHAAFMAAETPGHVAEFRLRRPDGDWIWVRELAHAAQRHAAGWPTRVVGVLNDISAEKQRLAEAERRTVQLRELAAALFRVEENERRELATLLHDDLGQRLVAAQLRVASLAQRAASDGAGGASGLEAVAEILHAAQETVRSLSFQLSPPILRDLGLVAGLQWLARELAGTWDLAVEVDDDATLPAQASSSVYLLFRCVRELLINVAKHAGVREARVVLRSGAEPGSLQVSVEDEGKGFDPAQLAQRLERRSFGLFSVRERIEGLGGRMLVHSARGRGTQVLLIIPATTIEV